jgi:hypothetical protein
MSALMHTFGHQWDRIFGRVTGTQLGSYYKAPPNPAAPPTQDTAANAAIQQDTLMRLRRGVYGNIFAGNAATPQTSTKSNLGG